MSSDALKIHGRTNRQNVHSVDKYAINHKNHETFLK